MIKLIGGIGALLALAHITQSKDLDERAAIRGEVDAWCRQRLALPTALLMALLAWIFLDVGTH